MLLTISISVFLLLMQFFSGWGILRHLLPRNDGLLRLTSLSIIMGMVIHSIALFSLELLDLEINLINFAAGQLLICLLLNIPFRRSMRALKERFGTFRIKFKIYDIVLWTGILLLLFVSAWRCYYTPVTPFDSLVGTDLVAKYAFREGTINSSVFNSHLPTVWYWSNQPFYAPFAMLMQVIYRLAGFAFGKIWLSILFISFVLFLYDKLKQRLHPIMAAFLILFFISIPEIYAYTFMVQTDLSNALFFFIGLVFFDEYYHSQQADRWRRLVLSSLFMGFACWARSETILFIPFGSVLILFKEWRNGFHLRGLKRGSLFLLPSLAFFLLWNVVYMLFYLPITPKVDHNLVLEFNHYFTSFFYVVGAMNTKVIFNMAYWHYTLPVFILCFFINIIIYRSSKGFILIAWLLFMYMMFALMIMHLSPANIENTFRRGFFKFLPVMILYIGSTPFLQHLSNKLSTYEASS